MHANLIVGGNKKERKDAVEKITSRKSIIPLEIKKIDDARQLRKLVNTSDDSSAFLIRGLDESTPQAQNALLKTLEEPPGGSNFVIVVDRIGNLLPTIISRCNLIRLPNTSKQSMDANRLIDFLESGIGKRFVEIEKHKKREEAIEFVANLVVVAREEMLKARDRTTWAKKLKQLLKTYDYLQANMNVNICLTQLAIKL